MRMGLTVATFATLLAIASSASAGPTEMTTSTSTTSCDEFVCPYYQMDRSALAPFDSTLGRLIGVSLSVNVESTTDFVVLADYPPGPYPHSAMAQLGFETPFNAFINGVEYQVDLTGSQTISLTGDIPEGELGGGSFSMSNSATFRIAPSLFSTFIGTNDTCTFEPFTPPIEGVCVRGDPQTWPLPGTIVQSSDILELSGRNAPPYTFMDATYALTYTYLPFAVPEPSTWALMLLGLGFVGLFARKTRASTQMGA